MTIKVMSFWLDDRDLPQVVDGEVTLSVALLLPIHRPVDPSKLHHAVCYIPTGHQHGAECVVLGQL